MKLSKVSIEPLDTYEAPLAILVKGRCLLSRLWLLQVRSMFPLCYRLLTPLILIDSVSYFSFTIGVLRTGWTLFLISPRNSSEAVAHLLKTTGATHLFVSVEPSVQALADNAVAHLTSSNVQKLDMPTFDHLFPIKGIDTSFVPEPLGEINMDDRALVLHSSGMLN